MVGNSTGNIIVLNTCYSQIWIEQQILNLEQNAQFYGHLITSDNAESTKEL